MKKFVSILFAVLTLLSGMLLTTANAEENTENSPIYVETLNEGVYNINVKSSSSMFRVVECRLTVSGDKMTAEMTLSGQGYEKLFMGTSEEALNSSDESCIYFEDVDGKYVYTVPVEALDKDIDCAAWSIRKEKWYDRVLVFESGELPEEAFVKPFNVMYIVIPAVILIAAVIAAIIVKIKKSKNKEN